MSYICRICSNSAKNKEYLCHEKMFGWGDEFPYFQCAQCGCLQIATVPNNLERYYPPNYYSFHLQPIPQSGLKSRLAGKRDFSAASSKGIVGKLLGKIIPPRLDLLSLGRIPAEKNMRILDVGCGRGQLLSALHRAGFVNLAGIDPFLASDFEVLPGLIVRKSELKDVQEKFDLIMLHHVFEHVDSARQTLIDCRKKLADEGKILLRFPTVESLAWQVYRENWIQLDAPRHVYLHTPCSLRILAAETGLKVVKLWHDSTAFQFWASELYLKGISLVDKQGNTVNPVTYFDQQRMKEFSKNAEELNAMGKGDQLATILSVA